MATAVGDQKTQLFKVLSGRAEVVGRTHRSPRPTDLAVARPSTHERTTLLLVEDEEVIRELIRKLLEQWGYSVLSARNGVEALDVAANSSEPITLMVTDVVMPHMNGRDLARRMRQQKSISSAPPRNRVSSVPICSNTARRTATLLNWNHGRR